MNSTISSSRDEEMSHWKGTKYKKSGAKGNAGGRNFAMA